MSLSEQEDLISEAMGWALWILAPCLMLMPYTKKLWLRVLCMIGYIAFCPVTFALAFIPFVATVFLMVIHIMWCELVEGTR